jgi:hypothetical protein
LVDLKIYDSVSGHGARASGIPHSAVFFVATEELGSSLFGPGKALSGCPSQPQIIFHSLE